MKNLKKNNKGFSLVELIVVVLIMAIIAVALAPQIMKWVNNSRITSDQNACGNIKSACQAAFASYQANSGKLSGNFTAKINGTSLTNVNNDVNDANGKSLESHINGSLGGENYKTKADTAGFDITIEPNGKVTVTCNSSNTTLE